MTKLQTQRQKVQKERYAAYQKYAQTIIDFQAYKKSHPGNIEKMTAIVDSELDTLLSTMATLKAQADTLN